MLWIRLFIDHEQREEFLLFSTNSYSIIPVMGMLREMPCYSWKSRKTAGPKPTIGYSDHDHNNDWFEFYDAKQEQITIMNEHSGIFQEFIGNSINRQATKHKRNTATKWATKQNCLYTSKPTPFSSTNHVPKWLTTSRLVSDACERSRQNHHTSRQSRCRQPIAVEKWVSGEGWKIVRWWNVELYGVPLHTGAHKRKAMVALRHGTQASTRTDTLSTALVEEHYFGRCMIYNAFQ